MSPQTELFERIALECALAERPVSAEARAEYEAHLVASGLDQFAARREAYAVVRRATEERQRQRVVAAITGPTPTAMRCRDRIRQQAGPGATRSMIVRVVPGGQVPRVTRPELQGEEQKREAPVLFCNRCPAALVEWNDTRPGEITVGAAWIARNVLDRLQKPRG